MVKRHIWSGSYQSTLHGFRHLRRHPAIRMCLKHHGMPIRWSMSQTKTLCRELGTAAIGSQPFAFFTIRSNCFLVFSRKRAAPAFDCPRMLICVFPLLVIRGFNTSA